MSQLINKAKTRRVLHTFNVDGPSGVDYLCQNIDGIWIAIIQADVKATEYEKENYEDLQIKEMYDIETDSWYEGPVVPMIRIAVSGVWS